MHVAVGSECFSTLMVTGLLPCPCRSTVGGRRPIDNFNRGEVDMARLSMAVYLKVSCR